MRKLMISLAASAAMMAGMAATLQATAQASSMDDGRLEATFTDSDVSVTHGLGMVQLILTGTGTVQGFGAATDVVGVVEDFAASPCGPGGASNSAQLRIVTHGDVLELSSAAMNCVTASGPQVTGTYRVDGQASTGDLRRCPRNRPRHRRRRHRPGHALRDTDPQAVSRLTGNLARRRRMSVPARLPPPNEARELKRS